MQDNAGENKLQKIINFIESIGATNWFSTPYEQWQNGLAESAINLVIRLVCMEILVQGCSSRCRCLWCYVHRLSRGDTMVYDILWTKVCFTVQCILMQGVCASQFRLKREGKAHSPCTHGGLPWIWAQHQHMVVLHARRANTMLYKPGTVWWTLTSFLQDINHWKVQLEQCNRSLVSSHIIGQVGSLQ